MARIGRSSGLPLSTLPTDKPPLTLPMKKKAQFAAWDGEDDAVINSIFEAVQAKAANQITGGDTTMTAKVSRRGNQPELNVMGMYLPSWGVANRKPGGKAWKSRKLHCS